MILRTESEVLRLFRCRPAGVAFDSILRVEMIPDLLTRPGISDLYVGRQGPDELGPRLVASVWATREAMRLALGETLDEGVFHPEYLSETTDRVLDWLPLAFAYRSNRAEPPGILRLVEGAVRSGDLQRYVAEAHDGTLADAAAKRGPIDLYLAIAGPNAFVTLSAWDDWATLQAATGGDVNRPIATRHAERLVEWSASHYEIVSSQRCSRPEPRSRSDGDSRRI